MSLRPPQRRAVVLPPRRITLREMATEAGVSVVTLRRRLRPIGDVEMRRLWATRLDLKKRPRGKSLAVFHACRKRFAEWRDEIAGGDLPVAD